MMRPLPIFVLAVCLGFGPVASLRAQQAPPVDPKAVLSALKDLRAKQTDVVGKEKAGVLAAINAALTDPAKAYEQALAATELQNTAPSRSADNRPGGPNRSVPAVRDGRREADARLLLADVLRDHNFVNGLHFQLVYLSLTWRRSMGVKARDLVPALLDYTTQVTNNYETLSTLEMSRKGLMESPFVAYFQVGPYISGLPEWSDHPFDAESIFQKTILPELRKAKDPRLLDYWDRTLQTEAARASATQNNLLVSRFNNIRRPSLLWSRAEDEQLLGNGNQAVADMLALIKAHADHPDYDKWTAELEGIVSAKLEPAAPPPGEVTVGPAMLVTPTPGSLATPPAR